MFLLSNLAKGFIVAFCIIALIAIIVFLIIHLSKFKVYKKVKEFKTDFEEAHNYLKENITNSINRFYVIAQLNDEYETHYIYFADKKASIISQYVSKLNSFVSKLDELVDDKKTKEIRNFLSEANDKLKIFKNEIKTLESEIEVFLSKDIECHNHAVPYQKKYREIHDLYDQNKESLSLIESTINVIFNKVDTIFEEFEKLTESAHYEDAINKIDSLNDVFDALKKSLEELPFICARLNLVIPKKIDELTTLFNKLEEENYPLYHLKINTTMEDIKTRLISIKKQVESFSYKNVSSYLDEIDDKIVELTDLLQHEIESKSYFDQNNELIYEKSYDLEKVYLKTKRIMPDYKKIYDINESYIDSMNDIQKEITTLGRIRRELDNYIHTSSMQPYSVLKKKLSELDEETNTIEGKIGLVNGYLKSLKTDSDETFKLLDKTYMSLKLMEYKLMEMDVSSFKETLANDFKQAYNSLDNIGMLIKITPINVEALNLSRNKVIELEEKIKNAIDNNIGVMNDAENSIVYANRFRKDFFDVRQSLVLAEENFYAGKFNESFDIAVSSIKQVKKM